MRNLLQRLVTTQPIATLFRPFGRGQAVVLMLHRFAHADRGVEGFSPHALRRILERLRRQRLPLVSLNDIVRTVRRDAGARPLPPGAVAFTLDDGYTDQAEVAAPIFAEYDCPATLFLTSGFLDGALWMWWDRAEYILDHANPSHVTLETDAGVLSMDLASPVERSSALARFVGYCKVLPDGGRERMIERLRRACEVDLPVEPPERYAPMAWDDVRRLASSGLDFGPHTVTHPVLSRVGDERARIEIVQSWRRLREELAGAVPIFCYPNGKAGDFGDREIAMLEENGLEAAVTAESGFIGPRCREGDAVYRLPRFACEESADLIVRYASGIERARDLVRRNG